MLTGRPVGFTPFIGFPLEFLPGFTEFNTGSRALGGPLGYLGASRKWRSFSSNNADALKESLVFVESLRARSKKKQQQQQQQKQKKTRVEERKRHGKMSGRHFVNLLHRRPGIRQSLASRHRRPRQTLMASTFESAERYCGTAGVKDRAKGIAPAHRLPRLFAAILAIVRPFRHPHSCRVPVFNKSVLLFPYYYYYFFFFW